MGVKVGVNGFGRIGRLVLRAALSNPDLKVVAVNHKSRRLPADEKFVKIVAHALKYDSIHGRINAEVMCVGDTISIDGQHIKLLSEEDPKRIHWGELGVDVVVESTGRFREDKDAALHLEGGAKRVIISAPGKGDVPMFVMGVNEHKYDPAKHKVISNASCTTNCLAPVAKVLHQKFGIVKGFMTTVHALTNDQQILDMPHRDVRRARSGLGNIIPTTTGAAKAVAKVIPELEGKLNGFAMRVPVSNVSVIDLVTELSRDVSVEEVNAALKDASEGDLKGILGYSELPLVSGDYNGDPLSGVVDALMTMVIGGNMAKVVAWYDNEWGYSCRIVDMILYMASKGL